MISNSDYELALNNRDYQKIINKAANKFALVLDEDDRKSCTMVGLWKAMLNYDIKKGMKFTSYLYMVVTHECKNVIRQSAKFLPSVYKFASYDRQKLYNLLDSLDLESQELIHNYYFKSMTLRELALKLGVSREAIRKRINKAVKQLCKNANRTS